MWPQVRAGFVLLHLVVIFVVAFPAPVGALNRAAWKVKTVQQDLQAWARILHMEQQTFEDTLYAAAAGYLSVRGVLLRPMGPYLRVCACDQPWRMFVAPVRAGAKLQLQVRRAGAGDDGWQTLFEERSAEHDWHEDMFKQERLRTQLSRWPWPGFDNLYRHGCAYFAKLAFSELPDAEAFRCRWLTVPTPTPEQARAGVTFPGSWSEPIVHERPK